MDTVDDDSSTNDMVVSLANGLVQNDMPKTKTDPNWGRIISAARNAGLSYDYKDTDLYLGSDKKSVQVLNKGVPVNFDRNHLNKLLRELQLNIKLDLNNGKAGAKGWGEDLTPNYVICS